jgi:hypothetical protein
VSSYFEHNSKSTAWDVLPFPAPMEVAERELTDDEAEAFKRRVQAWIETQNDSSPG